MYRDACIAQVPIAIEFQVYDPLYVRKDVRGHGLTINELVSFPISVRSVRQSTSFKQAFPQFDVSDWLGSSLTS
jgi:hypothetical protein